MEPMEAESPDAWLNDVAWCRRIALVVVFAIAALVWVGWTTGSDRLTRIYPTWPQMMPWTAVWLVSLGAAILAQSGAPSRKRVWAGRGLALLVAALAGITLVQYATGVLPGLDRVWFADALRTSQWTKPGRPSPQTAVSALLLSGAVVLIRFDRRTRVAWPACTAAGAAIPFVTVGAYLFDALALVGSSPSTGQAFMTALALLLLAAAALLARPDRVPVAWLLGRSDRSSLLRLAAILAGFPVVVALSRPALLGLGIGEHTEWTFSILLGTVIVGAVTFFFTQREHELLIAKEILSKQRADAEMRYQILAANAVDVIVHFRGGEVAWISPSVEAVLGGPLQHWTGSNFRRLIHVDDRAALAAALQRIGNGESVIQRFRVRSADGTYHWVDGHAKPYVDADGNADGLIAALRTVDDQVETEQRLERLARFDTLTGLVNRAEALGRLKSAVDQPRPPGTYVGVLFCDVDRFKEINDTWGHGIGDQVLATLASRISGSVRSGDTVGRTGGDEMLVILPDIHGSDELAGIAEKIRSRVAQPIRVSATTIHATMSIGATIAVPGEPVASITARADAAMYRAKSGRANAVICN
ncbi:PAS/PAC sensor-containing diguanylate cyclase [Mycobacterium lentiflavum]|uniref:PAS/PAC sensor-containing diguanylate cyclase n=2 Tax=Mycobacterium lentiflavum TaxID=141349 RepID=A0A0E4GWG5_MYCLN|nr:PAS/PAC sensor-containing diguanylate cyclase [Mycobacterium lentiflavum]